VRWRSWIRDGWLGEQLGFRPRRARRDDGLVRGWRVRRLEERRVLSVTSVDAGADVGPVNEGSQVDLTGVTFEDDDVPGNNPHTGTIDWGDGTVTAGVINEPNGPNSGEVGGSHVYADNGVYTVTITVFGDDGSSSSDTFQVTVVNVAPTLTVVGNQTTTEGTNTTITNIGSFNDPGFNNPSNPVPGGETTETFTYTIDWGDGTSVSSGTATVDTTGSAGVSTLGSFDGSHTYADNGVYTVIVTVFDDDGGSHQQSFTITVNNVAPTLTVVGNQTSNEGSQVSITDIGTFTDPGFNNPSNPIPGGETTETFTYTIDWGDGTTASSGSATVDTLGSAGTPTGGSFNGSHTYADNGVYTVTVTVFDDDGGSHQRTFTITVSNVAPTLTVVGNQTANEGSQVSITDIGTFTDPGFNNPSNPIPGGETTETFTYTIDWGDGTTASSGSATVDTLGAAGTPTAGSFNGSHTYADNGVYTVTVTVFDDDGGSHQRTFTITVSNVAPTLTVVGNQTTNEGSQVSITDIGTFTDPGFNNPSNPIPGGETAETFTYTIDWGDGTTASSGSATVDTLGSAGSPTSGSFNGSHTYADNGVYTVTVTVFDDDGGSHQRTFTITVNNVAPTLTVVGDQTVNNGETVTLPDIGTFTDPGFNNPSNPIPGGETTETFTYSIDWGDNTTASTGSATIDVLGSAGVLTSGSFDGNHVYTDAGVFTVTVTVFDDDGGSHQRTFTVTVLNIAPVLTVVGNQSTDEGAPVTITDLGTFTDADGESGETYTYSIDWGDGTTGSTGNATVDSIGPPTAGSFDGSHTYADNGVYTVTVTINDGNGGVDQRTFTITVLNVAPTLAVVGNQTTSEGTQVSITDIGTFTDPGFNNPSNPIAGGETTETFTYTIDWGDGTAASSGTATVDTLGSPGTPTAGSFNGAHTYADDGVYTVTVTVFDDDGGSHQRTFTISVGNVAPTLTVVGNQSVDEAANVTITDVGTFTDPGFNNPLNPIPGGETTETFTYTIDWGDGSAIDSGVGTVDVFGSPGTLTQGSFNASHVYNDSGIYTVTVTVFDDDGGSHQRTFTITVNNVAPTLVVVTNQTNNEGAQGSITDIGTFTDPGGDPGEVYTYTIDWGDGTTATSGTATVDLVGGLGVPTVGSFDGAHTFADDGTYTVTVTVTDGDGASDVRTFTVTVANVAPTLSVVGNQTGNEGTQISIADVGTFTDPGYNNPLNPIPGGETTETFTYTINWGDGSADESGTATIDALGGPGTPTAGSFGGSHIYADNGIYTVTVTVFDDDGGSHQLTFTITVNNVAPTVNTNPSSGDEGTVINVGFTDPGYDNPDIGSTETFTYSIDWGDGSAVENGTIGTVTPGGPGVLTSGATGHVYADNGVFFVTVTIFDDDGGASTSVVQVIVANVAPTLSTGANQTSNEGEIANVPGLTMFDQGTLDTHIVYIDWGDGTADYGFVQETPYGPPGSLAGLNGLVFGGHYYADNGVYTVTVQLMDDDGGVAVSTFQVTVNNVAPVFQIPTNIVANEGDLLNLPFLALFTDPGYNNPFNPLVPGGSTESFFFTINWGDGTAPTPLTLAAIQSLGGPGGFLTFGAVFGQHAFADNGVYTVTITLLDDDGGSATASLQVIVNNVAPIVTNVVPEDITADSIGNLFAEFYDPGADTWTITIVWGDGLPNTVLVIGPGQMQSFQSTHQYLGPPDPANPAAPIPLTITIDDGDEGIVTVETFFEVPGSGLVSVVALPAPPAPTLIGLGQINRIEEAPQVRAADAAVVQSANDNASGGDTAGEEDVRSIVLRIIHPSGELVRDPQTGRVKELLLTEAQLKDLRDFFRIWPDGHYRIDLREGKTERLIIEVYVREGEMVDRADIEELNAPAQQEEAPAPQVPENTTRIPDAAWENWQPRRRAVAPSKPEQPAEEAAASDRGRHQSAVGAALSAGMTSVGLRRNGNAVSAAGDWRRRRWRTLFGGKANTPS